MNGKHLDDLVTSMQKELNLLYTWLQHNKLSLHGQKAYYIIFHRARFRLTGHTSDLYMGGSILIATDKLKYLAVIIYDEMTWIPHITLVENMVSKAIGILLKARNELQRNSLINLYHSLIYPYLIYCIEAWGNATNFYLRLLLSNTEESDKNDYIR